jgi:AmmeMemoRadiSam system protein B/AmmeMemoRadiSam system protein A
MTQDVTLPDAITPDAGYELVSLARDTVERCALTDGLPRPTPDSDRAVLGAPGGAFVTVERGERLRGCCGHVEPDRPLWRVARSAAVDAARNDPRCRPVVPAELDEVTLAVTVLSTPLDVDAPSAAPDAVEVGRDGLVVRGDRRQGVLLPRVAVERGWCPSAFLTATCQKAGLPGDAWRRGEVDVERFTARSFAERTPRGDVVDRPFDGADADGTASDRPADGTASDRGAGSRPGPDQGDGEPVPDGGRPLERGERPPAVAGDFYPDTAAALREEVAACSRHEQGPGPLEDADVDVDPVTGVVVPHAALVASGPVAAHGYAALADGGDPETVVVFGPNHRGFGAEAAVAPHERWRTPLGTVPVDEDLAAAVVERSDVAAFDDRTHTGEHSIEMQLPFLQTVLPEISIVPVALSRPGRERAEQVGRDVAAAVEATGRDAAVVSSTDLTHYEPHGRAVETDEPLVDAIASFDVAAIAEAVEAGHTTCGPWATVAGLTAARELGAREGHRLTYATSGQTAGSRERVVGYCAVALA